MRTVVQRMARNVTIFISSRCSGECCMRQVAQSMSIASHIPEKSVSVYRSQS